MPKPLDLCVYSRTGGHVRVLAAYAAFPELLGVEVLEDAGPHRLGEVHVLPTAELRRAKLDPELCAELRAIASMKV